MSPTYGLTSTKRRLVKPLLSVLAAITVFLTTLAVLLEVK
jgi:hypothetical protein